MAQVFLTSEEAAIVCQKLRLEAELTQSGVAELLGTHQPTVSLAEDPQAVGARFIRFKIIAHLTGGVASGSYWKVDDLTNEQAKRIRQWAKEAPKEVIERSYIDESP